METFRWRFSSKVVAILHLTLSMWQMFLATIWIYNASNSTAAALTGDADFPKQKCRCDKNKSDSDLSLKEYLWCIWFPTFCVFSQAVFDVCMAIFLLRASELGASPETALKKADRYRGLSSLMLLCKICALIFCLAVVIVKADPGAVVLFTMDIIIRAGFIGIVSNFIQEIQQSNSVYLMFSRVV